MRTNSRTPARNQDEREAVEREFWSHSNDERPGVESVRVLAWKLAESRVFLEKLESFHERFAAAKVIVELGAGQGWASCIVADQFPDAVVLTTDIATDALRSNPWWQRVIGACPTGSSAMRSSETALRDASADLVFVFAAAHHFADHQATLSEIRRVLKPGGCAVYLHEPACKRWLYPLAYRRVNNKRVEVPEDLLLLDRVVEQAGLAGPLATVIPAPTTTFRGEIETIYYAILKRVSLLQRMLPCTVDIVFEKR